jgi:sulfur-oxidizing protein SoxY
MGACKSSSDPHDRLPDLDRRALLKGSAALVVVTVAPWDRAYADDMTETSQFSSAYKKFIGDRTPIDGPVTLDLPELAENGNMVPFTLRVDSPMTPDDHVKTLTLFSTGNPQPVIATFTFSPLSGAVRVSGRLRLARTQDVIAVAELSSGVLIKGTTKVAVNIGGCGAG